MVIGKFRTICLHPSLEAGFCGWHRGTGTVERHRPSRPQYA